MRGYETNVVEHLRAAPRPPELVVVILRTEHVPLDEEFLFEHHVHFGIRVVWRYGELDIDLVERRNEN